MGGMADWSSRFLSGKYTNGNAEMYWNDALFTMDASSHHELEIIVENPHGFSLYPNPFTEQINAQWNPNNFKPKYAEMYNPLRRLLWKSNLIDVKNMIVIPVAQTWSKGLYSLHLKGENFLVIIKLKK